MTFGFNLFPRASRACQTYRASNGLLALAILIMAAMTLVVAFGSNRAMAEDWLFFRGPQHDGKSSETKWQSTWPKEGPKISWRTNVGTGASSVVVKGDQMITMGNVDDNDVVTCLNVDTGKPVWTFKYPCRFERRMYEGGTAATPTIDGDRVYTFSHEGDLHCLNLKDGKLLWKKQVQDEFGGRQSRWKYASSPLVTDQLVIVDIGGDRSTVALNKMSGAPLWGNGSESAGYAAPITFKRNDKTGLLVFKGSALVAYSLNDGEQWWRIPWSPRSGVNASSPLVLDGRVFISSGYGLGGAMYDISGEQPKELWTNRDIATKISSCVHIKGYIYGMSERGQLLCIDAANGKTMWSHRAFGSGTLTAADGKLIIFGTRGQLVIADASPGEFKEIAQAQIMEGNATCWVAPVLANGRIYCRSNRGELACVDVRVK